MKTDAKRAGRATCRVIVDGPASGVWNMAIDEALLEEAAAGGSPTLRFYRWREPTLSLGYFQRFVDRDSHPPSQGLPIVRRSTGGGALVHDHELTYSLTLPPHDDRGRDTVKLTCLVHRALIDALGEIVSGLTDLSTCGEKPDDTPFEPFLCFQRRSPGDVVALDNRNRSHKLCGSAQRRRRGAVLQHGGLLLAGSSGAPELLGFADLNGPSADADKITKIWSRNILSAMDLQPQHTELADNHRIAAERIAAERFANPIWTKRR